MEQINAKELLEVQIKDTLKGIFDPEIPVNIYDLGLVYEINISDDLQVHIVMTLTAPNCPVAESLPLEVQEKISGLELAKGVDVEVVLDPPWNTDMMTDAAKLDLGFL